MNALIVYADKSFCQNCGLSADPRETKHDTVLSIAPADGCHVPFDAIASGRYVDEEFEEAVQALRPDLPLVEVL